MQHSRKASPSVEGFTLVIAVVSYWKKLSQCGRRLLWRMLGRYESLVAVSLVLDIWLSITERLWFSSFFFPLFFSLGNCSYLFTGYLLDCPCSQGASQRHSSFLLWCFWFLTFLLYIRVFSILIIVILNPQNYNFKVWSLIIIPSTISFALFHLLVLQLYTLVYFTLWKFLIVLEHWCFSIFLYCAYILVCKIIYSLVMSRPADY